MVTYDDFIQTCYDLSGDPGSANLAFIQRVGNVGYRRAMRLFGKQFEERTKTALTVASQQYYQLPVDYSMMKSLTVTVGTQAYPLEEVRGQQEWNSLNRSTSLSNSRPVKFFVRLNAGIGGDEVGIWPKPSDAGNLMTLVFEAVPRNIGNLAYTGGSATVSYASTAVAGTSTAFSPAMVGRYFQSALPSGDGQWYRVAAYNSATSLTLQNYYEGTNVTSGPFGIYDLFSLPEEAQMIPVYYTLWHYFLMRQNPKQAGGYKILHDADLKAAMQNQSSKSRDGVVSRGSAPGRMLDYPEYFPARISAGA